MRIHHFGWWAIHAGDPFSATEEWKTLSCSSRDLTGAEGKNEIDHGRSGMANRYLCMKCGADCTGLMEKANMQCMKCGGQIFFAGRTNSIKRVESR